MSVISKSSYELMDEIVLPLQEQEQVSEQYANPFNFLFVFNPEVNYAPSEQELLKPWAQPIILCAPEDEFDMPPALHYLSRSHADHV
jgi:hypothetical protein